MRHEDLKRLHEAGVRILERTGVVVQDEDTVRLFADRGFSVEGQRVRISGEQVEWAAKAAPRSFVLHARGARSNLHFGAGMVVSGTGGAPFVLEGANLRVGTLADLMAMIKVMHRSPNVDMVGFAVDPQDVPVEKRARRTLHALLTLSDKPPTLLGFGPDLADAALTTAEIIWGAGWHERPCLMSVLNSTSPLILEAETCRGIRTLAEFGQPICVTPCVMGGSTGPASMAGILALQHAETLAGLVLTQLVNEGNPYVYAGTSSVTSMVTGDLLLGVPQYWTMMSTTVELGHYLDLPVRAGGGLTDSHLPDMQAGIETAMGLAAVARCGVDFVHHGTGIMSSFNAVSFEKFIIDDELVGMIRARNLPIVVDEETLALDVIDAVGPGGNFLLEDHTATHCRDYERPTFFNRRRHDVWLSRGGWDLAQAARERFAQLQQEYQEPSLDQVTLQQLTSCCLI
ncbi:MAG: trimethylamine methyltransferase family protein [Thermoleophilia bacterium]